jgi:hypothetical protein
MDSPLIRRDFMKYSTVTGAVAAAGSQETITDEKSGSTLAAFNDPARIGIVLTLSKGN